MTADIKPVAWTNESNLTRLRSGDPVAKMFIYRSKGAPVPLYTHPPPSAPVGVEGLPEKWRREAPRARVDVGEDASLAWREAVYWCAFQLEAALAQQPAAVKGLLTCYQCGKTVTWLAPDSRCGDCTRLTPDEVRGQ